MKKNLIEKLYDKMPMIVEVNDTSQEYRNQENILGIIIEIDHNVLPNFYLNSEDRTKCSYYTWL